MGKQKPSVQPEERKQAAKKRSSARNWIGDLRGGGKLARGGRQQRGAPLSGAQFPLHIAPERREGRRDGTELFIKHASSPDCSRPGFPEGGGGGGVAPAGLTPAGSVVPEGSPSALATGATGGASRPSCQETDHFRGGDVTAAALQAPPPLPSHWATLPGMDTRPLPALSGRRGVANRGDAGSVGGGSETPRRPSAPHVGGGRVAGAPPLPTVAGPRPLASRADDPWDLLLRELSFCPFLPPAE